MAKVYADLIEKGLRTIEQVPVSIRKEVEEELKRRGEEGKYKNIRN